MTTHDTLPPGHYLLWQAQPKQSTAHALTEAVAAYTARFGERPGVALVNEAETTDGAVGIEVRVSATVEKGNMWLGRAES